MGWAKSRELPSAGVAEFQAVKCVHMGESFNGLAQKCVWRSGSARTPWGAIALPQTL